MSSPPMSVQQQQQQQEQEQQQQIIQSVSSGNLSTYKRYQVALKFDSKKCV